jgi:AcrR family transcriptional regulator
MPSEKSRDEVIAATRRAFAGRRQPTMEQIAAAAGVAVRTLYRLFGSRHALLREAGCAAEPNARDRVLEAALQLVGRRGLNELSMDDLAAAAGVSRATVYRLFPGKAALFGELIREYSPWEPVADVIDAMPNGDLEEVVPTVAQAIAEAMHDRVGLLLRIVFELRQDNPDTAEGMRLSMARGLPELVGYLSSQMQVGRLRQMDPILAIQLLAGPIVVHLLTQPLARALVGFDIPQPQALDQIVHAWLRAMAPEKESD